MPAPRSRGTAPRQLSFFSRLHYSRVVVERAKYARSTKAKNADNLIGSAPAPLIHPIIHRLVPKPRVLRLEHPVAFIREIQHFRWHLHPLERCEKLEAFTHVEPIIILAVNNQRRRLEFVGEQVRRKFPVKLALFPRRTFEFPFVEPKLLCRAVSRLAVE